jgi:hypothetical protein
VKTDKTYQQVTKNTLTITHHKVESKGGNILVCYTNYLLYSLLRNIIISFFQFSAHNITHVIMRLSNKGINHSNLNNFKMKTKFFTRIAGFALLLFFVAIAQGVNAANITTAGSGNWNATATWTGGVVPVAGDNVTIDGNNTVTVNVTNAACGTLTIGAASGTKTGAITFASTGSPVLTVSGLVTVGGSGGGSGAGTITMVAGATLSAGSFANGTAGATYTVNAGTVQITTTSTMPAGATAFATLEIVSGTCTLAANITATTLTIDNGATLAGATFTIGTTTITDNGTLSGAGAITNSGTFTVGNSCTLGANSTTANLTINPGATLAGSTFTVGVSGNLVVNGTWSGTGAISLSGAGATIDGTGTISNTNTITINANHTINATANLTIASIIAISGAVTITNNGIVNATNTSGITGTIAGSTWNNAASTSNLKVAGSLLPSLGTLTATATGNTVTYTGATNYIVKPGTYYNLTIAAAGTSATLASATTVNGILTLTSSVFAASTFLSMGTGSSINEAGGTMTGTLTGTYDLSFTGTTRIGSAATFGSSLRNVTVNMTAGNTLTLGIGFTCTGILTITQGTLNASTFTLNVAGNIVNNGTFTAGTSTVVLNGSGSQSIGGTTATTTFNNLTVNNAAGITLSDNVIVSTTLTLTSGIVTLGTLNLTAGSVTGGGNTNYVKCNNTTTGGTLTIKSITGSKTFPIGTSDYTPVTVNNVGTTQDFSALVFDGVLTNGTSGGSHSNLNHAVNKTWIVTNLGASPNATLTMQWNLSDEGAAFVRSNSYISHYTTSWDVPTASAAAGSNPYTLSRSGITSFSPFAVGDNVQPLPVKLLTFNAALKNKVVNISWSTASEINNSYFTIERSSDGTHFLPLFTKQGAGNSQVVRNYNAIDDQPLAGVSYYRLRQTDYNGASETFNIVSINNNVSQLDFKVISANPTLFSDHFVLNYAMPSNGNVRIVITGMTGNVVSDVTRPSSEGINSYEVNNTMFWKGGIYTVQLYYNNWVNTLKISKR